MKQSEPATCNQEAIEALQQRKPQLAIDLLQPVCNKGCTDPQSWFILGCALSSTNQKSAAKAALRECLSLNPGHVGARTKTGELLFGDNQLEEAATTLKDVLDNHPGHRPAVILIARTLAALERYSEAESYCRSLISGNSADAEIFALLAHIRKLEGNLDSAIELIGLAIDKDPNHVPAHVNLGLLHQARGNTQPAIASLTHAIKLAPNNPSILYLRAMSLIQSGELQLAANDLERSFQLNPADINTGGQLADVYRHLGRIPESVQVSHKILEVDPDNARAKFYAEAFDIDRTKAEIQRVPASVVRATYSEKDVGKSFEANLKGSLEYYAPSALNKLVRTAFSDPQQKDAFDILELGCGTGLCGSQFKDIARTLIGTDLSEPMLDLARKKNAYTDLYAADLQDVLNSKPASFDLVIAMDVLCYFGNLSDIFRQCFKLLRTGGAFALSVEKSDSDEPWLLHSYGHFVHSLHHLQESARIAGFTSEHCQEMVLRREANEQRVGYLCLFKRA